MTQGDAQHLRPTSAAVRVDDRRTSAEVNLGFLTRTDFDPTKWKWQLFFELTDEAADAGILSREAVFGNQVLVDSLSRQALLDPFQDRLPVRLAQAAGPGGHFGAGGWF